MAALAARPRIAGTRGKRSDIRAIGRRRIALFAQPNYRDHAVSGRTLGACCSMVKHAPSIPADKIGGERTRFRFEAMPVILLIDEIPMRLYKLLCK